MSIVYLDDGMGNLIKTSRISGVNVQVVNGLDDTETMSGAGNLLIGYSEDEDDQEERSGSLNSSSASTTLLVVTGNLSQTKATASLRITPLTLHEQLPFGEEQRYFRVQLRGQFNAEQGEDQGDDLEDQVEGHGWGSFLVVCDRTKPLARGSITFIERGHSVYRVAGKDLTRCWTGAIEVLDGCYVADG